MLMDLPRQQLQSTRPPEPSLLPLVCWGITLWRISCARRRWASTSRWETRAGSSRRRSIDCKHVLHSPWGDERHMLLSRANHARIVRACFHRYIHIHFTIELMFSFTDPFNASITCPYAIIATCDHHFGEFTSYTHLTCLHIRYNN
jgi:hypothetical protein